MVEISTSILSTKKGEESKTFLGLEAAKTDYIHIDVMDGKFVEKNTYKQMLSNASYIRRISNLPMDIHLMVKDVETGIEVFLLIRQLDKKIPVLILSSYTELCAASLKIGTSDFVRKDGGIDELCARIEAALNRYPGPEITGHPSEKVYQLSPTSRFYPANSTLEIGDQRYPLKTMLAELLTIFCQNQNSFIPGTIICRRLWNNDNASKISLLRDYISELRKILKADTSLKIRSSYGKGYCFSTPEK